MRKTKIIATIGPATESKENLQSIINDGVNVCRLNFSHGSHEDHLKVLNNIKEINRENGTHIATLGDLQGPKLRVGIMAENTLLVEGKEITFTDKECIGNADLVYMNYKDFAKDVKKGEFIRLDDGKLEMQILKTNGKDTVKAKVTQGGLLKSNKGVNLPNTVISLPSLTTIKHGILRTPYFAAISDSVSTFIFIKVSLENSLNFSNVPFIALHGPHQLAEKLTKYLPFSGIIISNFNYLFLLLDLL